VVGPDSAAAFASGAGFSPSGTSVDKNALAILNANLIPLPNAPFGCNLSVANYNAASPDPTDPNRCYDLAVSPSTYWREELFSHRSSSQR